MVHDPDPDDREEEPTRAGAGPPAASSEPLPDTASAPLEATPGAARLPAAIGGYRVVRRLGEGGMGIVYEAEQSSPRRRIALKVVRGGPFVDEARLRMFRREAEALARLKHPNIGAIYEAGRTEDGQHFFAMELVEGRTLADVLRSPPATREELRRRLGLFRTICEAVHHAHQKGVIHRDLKPSNIVIDGEGSPGAEASVKILDFGLARITDADVRSTTLLTEVGVIKGTLAYMSPEQTRGDRDAIDVRADVYALGVILYEMVAGRRPYDIARSSLVEALRVICEEPPRSLGRSAVIGLDADVETIALKALEKEPARRYGSAAALGGDVERYLASLPILARPPSRAYQLRKFAARNRTLVGGVLATILVLAAGVVVSSTLGIREARQRRAAERSGYVANVTAAEASLRLFELAEVKRRLAACPPPLRGWEWRHLSFRSDMSERILTGHTARVYPVAVSPDGTLWASGSADPENAIRLWDAASGMELRVLEGGVMTDEHSGGVRSLAFSPDGTRLASGSDDRLVRMFEVASGRKLLDMSGHEDRVNAVAFTPDGREVVSGSYDGTVRRFDAGTGAGLGILGRHEDQVWGVAVCGDGSRVVSGGRDRAVRIWERTTGRERLTVRAPDPVTGVACSPTGDRVAATLIDGTVRSWNTATGAPVGAPGGHDDLAVGVAFSPDGRTIATAAKDRTVRLFDAASGARLATLVGHDNVVVSVAFDPGGKTLLSGSWDRTVRVWSAEPGGTSSSLATTSGLVVGLSVTPDGSRILSGTAEEGIQIWDARSGAALARIPNGRGPLRGFDLSPDGSLVVAVQGDLTFRTFEIPPGGEPRPVHERALEDVTAATFLPDSREMLLGSAKGGTVRRFDVRTGETRDAIETDLTLVRRLAVSPDASRAVVAGGREARKDRGALLLVDLRTGRVLAEQEIRHVDPSARIGNPVGALAFRPDGKCIATTHLQDFTVRLWDGETLDPLATSQGHTEMVPTAAFSPDGSRLATGGHDYAVRLWDGTTGEPLLALRSGDLVPVLRVAFTPDGSTIVSAGTANSGTRETTIRLWRTRP